ncbi:MAG: peptidylprolyl isomerase [Betaproteobacteria bacterium]|nr:peptidylprolyl isomerase [Betaproteobacteria bacterium]
MRLVPILAALVLFPATVTGAEPVATATATAAAPAHVPRTEVLPPVAKVNGREISAAEYEQALIALVRQRYYHRAPPEAEMGAVRVEVVDSLIDLILVADEAKKRGIEPDAAQVGRELERIEARFRKMPGWEQMRAAQVARWRADLEERSRAEILERRVRTDIAPAEAEVRAFYDRNPGLFTEPEKVRLSVILLRVDPSAGKSARDKAREEAAAIRTRLAKGADFAEIAKIHSGDPSAEMGGDMGFVHRGALPEPVQEVLDKLADGELSQPLDVLEGIAIVRVGARQPAALRPYEAVTARARELQRRGASDAAWKATVARLRAAASIEVNTGRYPDLAAAPETAQASAPR